MATKAFLIALAVIAAVAAPALGEDFIVGDDNGWKNNNFDYAAWAQSKEFHVGDRLVFKYSPGSHNVFKVDGAGFKDCKKPVGSEPFKSGNDVIELKQEGKKWYICGVGDHCSAGGMKLVINVLPAGAVVGAPSQPPNSPPTPSSPAPSAASDIAASKFAAWTFAAVCGVLFFMFLA
ncbi:PREDICTED: basic blue protein-like [Ipomoea nil]|uniref:basic blue protein-like n=1 Tax=Ipomoea nil TaxID=35883 RepID=UPI000901C29B|nr:PREDICTED: basic blue protein-like [Ipomoea nil]XP_019172680.1 PREDICTED: basic blue protein-like [Ipomoea nil]